jgi:hypothetical protein
LRIVQKRMPFENIVVDIDRKGAGEILSPSLPCFSAD